MEAQPFQTGDAVLCVDASPDRITGAVCPLIAGKIYIIDGVWLIDDKRDGAWGVCFDLVGVPRMDGDIAYNARRFRHVGTPVPYVAEREEAA